jgi:uncharacterized protein (TIGR02646 family)
MRSVEKGGHPKGDDGQPIEFGAYGDAAPYLKERIGRWCSFCERWIATNLAVEHKLPKKTYPELELDWANFLLACTNCNSTKGTREQGVASPLWPDEHRTSAMFEYFESGAIRPADAISETDKTRVRALLKLVGLDKQPKQMGAGDHRFFDRLECWSQVRGSLEDLKDNPTPKMRDRIVSTAVNSKYGGYSIWTTVFAHDADMLARLAAAHPGTRTDAD